MHDDMLELHRAAEVEAMRELHTMLEEAEQLRADLASVDRRFVVLQLQALGVGVGIGALVMWAVMR